jgi:hypothetical protein
VPERVNGNATLACDVFTELRAFHFEAHGSADRIDQAVERQIGGADGQSLFERVAG